MVGQLEMVIGHQQNPAILLNIDIAGFCTRYARRQPGITHAMGQIARQSNDAVAIVAKLLNGMTLGVEHRQGRKRAMGVFVMQANN
ncbi:hypothetical protein D3C85_1548510 [compost metagenome]